ncbi:hypothetical protein ACIRD3_37795 [Kitasatospora sp. NPDC093550]|uniref:hypothetical protein n=1 Tax=Kitasatospora sp. NPDC093550 TaxID=3364089 RepID=UPI0038268265
MGRHRRPADPGEDTEELDAALLAVVLGEPITVDGVATAPGSTTSYLYRRTHHPDGTSTYCTVRIADLPTYGFPPPDP